MPDDSRVRVLLEQVTGYGLVFVQNDLVRVDKTDAPRVDECKCCRCRACPDTGDDRNRVYCCLNASASGLTFFSGNFGPYCFATGGNVDGVETDLDSICACISNAGGDGVSGPCGGRFDCRSFAPNSGGGCPRIYDSDNVFTDTYASVEGSITDHACHWQVGGYQPSGTLTALSSDCSEALDDQGNYVSLTITYSCGYWQAVGNIRVAATANYPGPVSEPGGAGMTFQWFYGYVADDCKQLYNDTITIPNLQTITDLATAPKDELGNVTTALCITEGGSLNIQMGCQFNPCDGGSSSSSSSSHSHSSSSSSNTSSSSSSGTSSSSNGTSSSSSNGTSSSSAGTSSSSTGGTSSSSSVACPDDCSECEHQNLALWIQGTGGLNGDVPLPYDFLCLYYTPESNPGRLNATSTGGPINGGEFAYGDMTCDSGKWYITVDVTTGCECTMVFSKPISGTCPPSSAFPGTSWTFEAGLSTYPAGCVGESAATITGQLHY